MVSVGKLRPHQLEPVLELATSGFCLHRKWGCGRITTIDTVSGALVIDFAHKSGHAMQMGFAVGKLEPISPDHIMARKLTDLEGLAEMAALNHLDLIRLTLKSFGGQATIAQIQASLVPDVISSDWKKWWEVARKEMKQDGHFTIPLKKSEPIVLHEEEVSTQARLLQQLSEAKSPKPALAVVAELIKFYDDLEDKPAAVATVVEDLNQRVANHRKQEPSVALEAIFARDEILALSETEAPEGQTRSEEIWADVAEDFTSVLLALPAAKQRVALASFKRARPETWKDELLLKLPDFTARLCGETAKLVLDEEKGLEELKENLGRLINQHQASSELLLWLAKERSDAYADILGPEVFRAMLSAIERDQFNEIKANRLGDFILSDMDLLPELIQSADIEVIRDVTRTLQMSTSFPDMEKRSLLARIVKLYPVVQELISGDSGRQREDNTLVVSWNSLETRRMEYEDLVRKKIPANSKEIAIARSYGDLRENHEYKSAKEMQKVLMARKAELETDLGRARGTDFSDVTGTTVVPGTRVRLQDLVGSGEEQFDILGAWDTNVENGIISYLTPLAQALINHKEGEDVSFEMGGQTKSYKILSIAKAPVEDLIPAPQAPPEDEEPTPPAEDEDPPAPAAME